jgi:hypothetical protein
MGLLGWHRSNNFEFGADCSFEKGVRWGSVLIDRDEETLPRPNVGLRLLGFLFAAGFLRDVDDSSYEADTVPSGPVVLTRFFPARFA